MNTKLTATVSTPDKRGYFGKFGGRFVPETLMSALEELESAYQNIKTDQEFWHQLQELSHDYVGRPTPIYRATNLEQVINGPQIYLKREDLAHTGAHKINNALGQGLLAVKMGKKRIIAETGAGQHGVATATICAMLKLQCVVYMGKEDIKRQSQNVHRMQMLGAEVVEVATGSATLKDAINEAIRDWVTNVRTTHYLIGSAVGPHPYPYIVRDLQSVIGIETKTQCLQRLNRLPDYVIACVGGGSNAIGIFSAFIDDPVTLIGVEAAGTGLDTNHHAATITLGSNGVLHGSLSYVLQDTHGQISQAHSISAGLDYPGVGPEHAYLKETGRVQYYSATDKEAIQAFKLMAHTEGIIPALEPSHAVAYLQKAGTGMPADTIVVLLMSGRGDKDIKTVYNYETHNS